jgi:hypothetical protein
VCVRSHRLFKRFSGACHGPIRPLMGEPLSTDRIRFQQAMQLTEADLPSSRPA